MHVREKPGDGPLDIHDRSKWEELGPAQGDVRIPAGHINMLKVSQAGIEDLSPLRRLDANGLHILYADS